MAIMALQNMIVCTGSSKKSLWNIGADNLKNLNDLLKTNDIMIHGFQYSFWSDKELNQENTVGINSLFQVYISANNPNYDNLTWLENFLYNQNPGTTRPLPRANEDLLLYRSMSEFNSNNMNGALIVTNMYQLKKDTPIHIVIDSYGCTALTFMYSLILHYDII